MNSKYLIMLILMAKLSSQTCLNSQQADGNCSACKSAYILISGSCVNKNEGCAEQNENYACKLCQQGYYLQFGICYRKNDLNQSPTNGKFGQILINGFVAISSVQKLEPNPQRRKSMSNSISTTLQEFQHIFRNNSQSLKITSIQYIDASIGKYYLIIFYLNESEKYEVLSVTEFDQKLGKEKTTILSFQNLSKQPAYTNPIQFAGLILPQQNPFLQQLELYKITKETYYEAERVKKRKIIYYQYLYKGYGEVLHQFSFPVKNVKADLQNGIIYRTLHFIDMIAEEVYFQWSDQRNKIKFIERGNSYFGFRAKNNRYILAKIRQAGRILTIYGLKKQMQPQYYSFSSSSSSGSSTPLGPTTSLGQPVLSGYTSISLADQILNEIVTKLKQQIAELKEAVLTSAQAKILGGLNVVLTFNSTLPGITYEVKAVFSLINRQLSVTSLTKKDESSSIKQEAKVPVKPPQQYTPSDLLFQDVRLIKSYDLFKQLLRPMKQLIIVSKSYIKQGNTYKCRIKYENQKYAQYIYRETNTTEKSDVVEGVVEPIGFFINNVNVFDYFKINKNEDSQQPPTTPYKQIGFTSLPAQYRKVTEILKQNLWKMNVKQLNQVIVFQQVLELIPSRFTTTVLTPSAKFGIQIYLKTRQLQISSSQKNSQCLTLPLSLSQQRPLMKFLTQKIATSNNISLTDLKVKPYPDKFVYRLLFESPYLRKIQYFALEPLSQINTLKNGGVDVQDNQTEVVDNKGLKQVKDYEDLMKAFQSKQYDWINKLSPIYIEKNRTWIQGLVNFTRGTYFLRYNSQTKQKQIVPIRTGIFGIPKQFQFLKIVYPVQYFRPNPNGQASYQNKITTIFILSLGGSFTQIPTFNPTRIYMIAQIEQNKFKMLYNSTNQGLLSTQFTLTRSMPQNIQKFKKVVDIQVKQLTNCKKYNRDLNNMMIGYCQQCTSQNKLQFQGSCYDIIPNCYFQFGYTCFKCQRGYVKFNGKCINGCDVFNKIKQ